MEIQKKIKYIFFVQISFKINNKYYSIQTFRRLSKKNVKKINLFN